MIDSLNSSLHHSLKYSNFIDFTSIAILILLAIACILGNLLSIIVVYRNKNMQEPSGLLMTNLATADLCIGLIFMTTTIIYTWKKTYILNEISCKIRAYLVTITVMVSQFTAAYIAMDRCIYVCKPLHYHLWVTKSKIICLITFTWVLASLFSAMPLIPLHQSGFGRYEYISYMYSCWLDIKNFPQNGGILILIFSIFVGLLLIVLICYIIILYKAKKVHTTIQPFRKSTNTKQQLPSRMVKLSWINKPTKTSVILVGVYLICAAPTAIFGITMTFNHRYYNVSDIGYRVMIYWCMYANALANPFIFGFSHRDFRQTYRSLCCKCSLPCFLRFFSVKQLSSNESLSFTITQTSFSEHRNAFRMKRNPSARATAPEVIGEKNTFLNF